MKTVVFLHLLYSVSIVLVIYTWLCLNEHPFAGKEKEPAFTCGECPDTLYQVRWMRVSFFCMHFPSSLDSFISCLSHTLTFHLTDLVRALIIDVQVQISTGLRKRMACIVHNAP